MIINSSKVFDRLKNNAKEKHKIRKSLLAFFFGGLVGITAQAFYYLYKDIININHVDSSLLTSASIMLISYILTCVGVFDKLANIAYCGILIPITGFANSITSSALEGKSEGLIFGIGGKIFSLIGSVCTYGIVSSIFLGIIYYLFKVISNA